MKVTNGFGWIGTCTAPFEETMAFFRDILGLTVTDEGIPWVDKRFTRYVQFALPNGQIFEIVDGPPAIRELYPNQFSTVRLFTKPKWWSAESTIKPRKRATAAICASADGMGRPLAFCSACMSPNSSAATTS